MFGSNDLWIYYFSLKSNFKANTNTLAVHLLYSVPEIPKQNLPVVLCNIPELGCGSEIKYFKFIRPEQKMKICHGKNIEVCNLLSNCTKLRSFNFS